MQVHSIELSIKRAQATHSNCCYPSCLNKKIRTVPHETRLKILKELRFYLPKGVRACTQHFESDAWINIVDDENCILNYDKNQIEDMVDVLRAKPKINPTKKKKSAVEEGNFSIQGIPIAKYGAIFPFLNRSLKFSCR